MERDGESTLDIPLVSGRNQREWRIKGVGRRHLAGTLAVKVPAVRWLHLPLPPLFPLVRRAQGNPVFTYNHPASQAERHLVTK